MRSFVLTRDNFAHFSDTQSKYILRRHSRRFARRDASIAEACAYRACGEAQKGNAIQEYSTSPYALSRNIGVSRVRGCRVKMPESWPRKVNGATTRDTLHTPVQASFAFGELAVFAFYAPQIASKKAIKIKLVTSYRIQFEPTEIMKESKAVQVF